MTAWSDPLPPMLAEIRDAIGLSATLELVRWRGGRRVYVPGTVPEDHPLADAIGLEAARSLSGLFPAERIEVPRAVRLVREIRDREIRAAAAATTQSELARKHRLTERQIRTILSTSDQPLAGDIDHRQACLL